MPHTSELSFCEELLWLASRSDANAPPFFDCPPSLSIVARLESALSHAALEASFDHIVCRHEVLRSTFQVVDGRPVRVCAAPARVTLSDVDLRGLGGETRSALVTQVLSRHVTQAFDLARGPLLRAMLVTLGDDDHVLALTVHHIVFDSWSKRVLALELKQLYEAYTAGCATPLKPLAFGYRDYVQWQRRRPDGPRERALVDFWQTRLRSRPDVAMPCDGARSPVPSTRSGTCSFVIRGQDAYRVRVMSRQHKVTVATVMLAVLKLFLHRVTGLDDITVGLPVSDRRRHEFEGLIGLFTNVVVVRTAIAERMTFTEVLERVQASLSEAYCHQDLPYGYLRHLVGGHTPLYRVVFNFVPSIPASAIELRGLRSEPLPIAARSQSLCDMSVYVQSKPGGLACRFVYQADVFSRARMQALAQQFEALVTAVMAAPAERLGARAIGADACVN